MSPPAVLSPAKAKELRGGALEALLAGGKPSSEAIDRFLAEHSFPLVEGHRVTFVFRGHADRVLLQHFIYGLPTSQPFHRVRGTDLWYFVIQLRRRSRLQYKLNVIHGDQHAWILDPLNPERAHDPFGANSVCHTEGAERPAWTLEKPENRKGDIHELRLASAAFGEQRSVGVYVPARFRANRRYPLLVVHDGSDFLRYSSLRTVLDNLIDALEIPPLLVALTNAGDRLREYPDDPRHGRFLTEEVLPTVGAAYPLLPEPAARGLLGASFGAVGALSTAWRHPGVWGRLLLLSGSFAFTDIGDHRRGPAFDPVVDFMNEFRRHPGRPSEKVFMSCGIYESLIYENRSLVPLLQETGMDVRFVEARDGHNWENWRDRLRQGLSWLFPGPLWMVYE